MTADGTSHNQNSAGATATARDDDRRHGNPDVTTIGLVTSPEFGERVAQHVSQDLPELLANQIDDQVTWRITTVTDPLTGSNLEAPGLLDEVFSRSQEDGWDYAIGLTDLPIRRNERFMVAGISVERRCAWVSLPALGVVRLHSQVRSAILQLMREMHWGALRGGDDHGDQDGNAQRPDPADYPLTRPSIARREAGAVDLPDADVQFVAQRIIGTPRLLTGMVQANAPWTLFPKFRTTIATAFATGAYGLIFPTLWRLGDTYEMLRLVALMIVSMAILIGWIIISHDLWEFRPPSQSSYLTTLYNTATVLTIASAVMFAYAAIFLLILVAGLVFVPSSLLGSTLQHPASAVSYVRIAWVTASVAMVAGAVGAGLEDTEAVRDATFGWRQQKRFERSKAREGENAD